MVRRDLQTCPIAISIVLKSEVDMLKIWVWKRIRSENNSTNHHKTSCNNLQWLPKLSECNFSVPFEEQGTHASELLITALNGVFQPNYKNLQKVGHDIVLFNDNVLGHAWHIWCKKGTTGKKMSCSLLICHMQIFESFVFRTMALWIWITFFLIRTVYVYVYVCTSIRNIFNLSINLFIHLLIY